MRSLIVFIIVLAAAGACGRSADHRSYSLQGQVLALDTPHKQLTIKHEAIKGLMPAMTMPYQVEDAKLLNGPKLDGDDGHASQNDIDALFD